MKICHARPQLVFTFYNRFSSTGRALPQSVRYRIFHLHASCLLPATQADSHAGSKVYIWNVFDTDIVQCTPNTPCNVLCRKPRPPRLIPSVTADREKLKLRWEASIGYESRKCTHAVQGGLLGVIRVLQSDINICVLQPATSQARLHGVPGQTSMYFGQWVKTSALDILGKLFLLQYKVFIGTSRYYWSLSFGSPYK